MKIGENKRNGKKNKTKNKMIHCQPILAINTRLKCVKIIHTGKYKKPTTTNAQFLVNHHKICPGSISTHISEEIKRCGPHLFPHNQTTPTHCLIFHLFLLPLPCFPTISTLLAQLSYRLLIICIYPVHQKLLIMSII